MTPIEIFDYAVEGMKWLPVSGALTYIGAMSSSYISGHFSKKIKSQAELDSIVEIESKKLGLTDVKGILHNIDECCAYYDSKDIPTIEIGGAFTTQSDIRHELYHIYRGDCIITQTSDFIEELKYWIIQEPRACLYQSTGIKL
ncbi:MAG: hypothetical protein ACP5N1_02950 [Candidatus Woesearchaeota archaeon]